MVAQFPSEVSALFRALRSSSIPWLDQMGDCEDYAQDYAKTADSDVGDAQERVLAAHDSSRGDENRLRAAVDLDREVCNSQQIAHCANGTTHSQRCSIGTVPLS